MHILHYNAGSCGLQERREYSSEKFGDLALLLVLKLNQWKQDLCFCDTDNTARNQNGYDHNDSEAVDNKKKKIARLATKTEMMITMTIKIIIFILTKLPIMNGNSDKTGSGSEKKKNF